MSKTIRIRRNTKANIPVLQLAEPFWATDEYKLYIGDGSTNYEVPNLDSTTGTVAKMQLTKDPYPASTAAPASTLAEEIEELRYQLTLAIGRTYWYQDPDISLETLYTWYASGYLTLPSGTKAWFYQNTAPTGWTLDATPADAVLAVKGGSNAYNANGGTQQGTWTQPNHTHSGVAHNHQWYHFTATNTDDQTYDVNGTLIDFVTAGSSSGDHPVFASSSEGRNQLELYTSNAAAGTTGNGATAATWRPLAQVGIICTKD